MAGEPNALRFTARQRGGRAFQREIFEADVLQEAEPAANFFEHFGRDQLLVAFEIECGEKLSRIGNSECADLRATRVAGPRRNFALAVSTVTARACGFSRSPEQSGQRITLMYCSSWRICGSLLLVRYLSNSSGIRPSNVPPYFWAALPARQVNVMCSSPVPQSQISRSFGSRSRHGVSSERAFGEREFALHRFGDAAVDMPLPAAQILPRADEFDATLFERLFSVCDESVGIETEEFAQAIAGEAHALGAVEAEQLRRWFAEADAALGAGEVGGEDEVAGLGAGGAALWISGFGLRIADCGLVFRSRNPRSEIRNRFFIAALVEFGRNDDAALADGEGGVDCFGQAAADCGAGFQAIDDDFDVVPHLPVERRGRR